jgi:4-hydroxy-tetrahydrodipicolinate synthase
MSRNRRVIKLRGAMTAIATPFRDDGSVDLTALEKLAAWQVDSGIHGLVPCGTTGEGATLRPEEHAQVIETVVRVAAGRVPVLAGCGTNDTRTTIAGAQRAAEAGADGLLVVTPYYNKPNRSGMLAHFGAIASAVDLPIVAYNVPGRTGQNLSVEQTLSLAEIPGVVGVKEAAGSVEQLASIVEGRPEGFAVLTGDDALALASVALGADGVISVVSNEAPRLMSAMMDAALSGDFAGARSIHYRLLPLMRVNFVESNPVPVKTALARLGRCGETLRPPLGPPEDATRRLIDAALRRAGLLEGSA